LRCKKIEAKVLKKAVRKNSGPHNSHLASEMSLSQIVNNVKPDDVDLIAFFPAEMLAESQIAGKYKGMKKVLE